MSSAPSQELPAWLSYSTSIFTDNAGDLTTSATLLQLPLTYYGPSIPLGTDGAWTYGGLTSPASSTETTPATSSSTQTSEPSSSATPPPITSSETLPPTSTATPPPSSSSITSTSSSFSPTPTPSLSTSSTAFSSTPSSSSSSPTGFSAGSHLGGGYIGAIVGSIVAAVILLLLALLFLRCVRQRRTRNGHDLLTPPPERHSRHSRASVLLGDEPTSGADIKPPRETIWTGWSMVHSNGSQTETTVAPVEGAYALVHDNGSHERIPGEGSPRGSGEEADPFLKRGGDADMAQARPRLVSIPSLPSGVYSSTRGSADSASTGASGYGTVVDPANSQFNFSLPITQFGHIIPPSVLLRMVEERENGTIEEEDEHEQSSPLMPPPPLDPDGYGTSRASKKSAASMRSTASLQYPGTPNSFDENAELMTARKIRVDELGRAEAREVPSPTTEAGPSSIFGGPLAAIGRMSWFQRKVKPGAETPHDRPLSFLGRPYQEDLETGQQRRPISGVSAKSAESTGTVYHDAQSRPETPLLAQPPVAHSRSRLNQSVDIGPTVRMVDPNPAEQPPAYEDFSTSFDTSSSTVRDVLDEPAPRPASPFASSSSATARTIGPSFPPGLNWQPSASTLGDGFSSGGSSAGIAIEVLEEEPPSAAPRWRTMAGLPDRRLTFGGPPVLVHPNDTLQSEQGSLHSMRSHLSPRSASHASGSAPASFISHTPESSRGTNSSRFTRSSGPSLAHSGSISSDGRQRRRVDPNANPGSFGRLSVGATGNNQSRLASPSPLHDTVTSITGSDVTTETTDPVTGMVLRLPRATMGRN